MQGPVEKLIECFKLANGGNGLWFLALSALIFLFLFEKEKRTRLALPALLLALFILNPLTFYLFGKLHLAYVYWRTFWMIPIIPVLACAAVSLIGRFRRELYQVFATALLCATVILLGVSVYRNYGEFRKLDNPYLIPQEAATVGDALLKIDPEPYVVPTPYLGTSLRQYSTDIHQMFGRDYYGFIGQADEEALEVGLQMQVPEPDLDMIRSAMERRGYDYLIRVRQEKDDELFPAAGFEKLADVERYAIYRLNKET